MFKKLITTKTFWAGCSALVFACEQYLTGESTLTEALQLAMPAVLAIFLRDGIAKVETK